MNEFEQLIKNYFKDKLNSPSTLTKAIKNVPPEIALELKNFLYTHPEYERESQVITAICKNQYPKKCKTCGKQMTYAKSMHNDYCCNSCAQKSSEVRSKIEQTCLEKYHQIAPTKNKLVIEKRNTNNLKKYGVKHPILLDEVKEKKAQTNQERYGGNSPAASQEVRDKMKETCLERYGVKYSGQIKSKIEKTKNTFIENYGVDHPMKFQEIKEKLQLKNREKYFNNLVNLCKQIDVIPLFSKDEYFGGYRSGYEYYWHCNKCDTNFISSISHRIYDSQHLYLPRCLKCYPYDVEFSKGEDDLVNFCKQYFPNLIQHDHDLIKPYELDIVIPEKKIAIEFNGVYWHSNEKKDKFYHLMKTEMCEKVGYKLIHIYEHQWLNQKELLMNKLKALFNIYDEHIHARKCIVKEISVQEKNTFLNANHIQGEDKSSIKLGLFDNDELIAVMTFGKPRFNKNYEWELIRYATSKHVCGGAGKLLKYFERNFKPNSMITYADRSYSQGNLYKALSFKELEKTNPNYFYYKNGNVISRYQAQKRNLQNILKEQYDENLTEEENMFCAGYLQIFDSGNIVYAKIKDA